MDELETRIGALLEQHRQGETGALERALPLVYDELRRIAEALFGGQAVDHTLQPTALVGEAWMRLARGGRPYADRQHFLAVAARAMRQVLANHARARGAQKRGGGSQRVTLAGIVDTDAPGDVDPLALEECLQRLEALSPRQARIVELRVFCDLTISETAEQLEVSERTVVGDWQMAKLWLQRELAG